MRTRYEGWVPVSLAWIIMSAYFAFWLFVNVVIGVITGAFLGWTFSLTFLDRWIVDGLRAFRLNLQAGNLYQVGAAAEFLSSFFKFSIKSPTRDFKKGREDTKNV